MNVQDFLKNFAEQFDDTDISEFTMDKRFRELDEWSSLNGLAIMNMIERKYGVRISLTDFRAINTIQQLFDLVESKQ